MHATLFLHKDFGIHAGKITDIFMVGLTRFSKSNLGILTVSRQVESPFSAVYLEKLHVQVTLKGGSSSSSLKEAL